MAVLGTGSVKTRILDLLRQSPFGKTSAELATALGMHARRVAPRLIELRDTGRVAVCDVGRCNYWFAPEHADNARAQAAREGWKFTFGAQERKAATTVAAALAPTPMKPGSGPRITIAPPFVDRRFAVDNPAPVFGGLPPGKYPLATGSAIARAYGEGSRS